MNTITRTLDWTPHHDPRNRDYPIRATLTDAPAGYDPATIGRQSVNWSAGPMLDQGDDGACVGYAFTGALMAEPIDLWPATNPADATALAERLYTTAKILDPWPGDGYNGTSVTAGAKATKAAGHISAYRWCFGIDDVIDALCQAGPVVLGLFWRESMKTAHDGILTVAGPVIGGHATVATAYAAGTDTAEPAVRITNSWGIGWGTGGHAWLNVSDLAGLLEDDGEACVIAGA